MGGNQTVGTKLGFDREASFILSVFLWDYDDVDGGDIEKYPIMYVFYISLYNLSS